MADFNLIDKFNKLGEALQKVREEAKLTADAASKAATEVQRAAAKGTLDKVQKQRIQNQKELNKARNEASRLNKRAEKEADREFAKINQEIQLKKKQADLIKKEISDRAKLRAEIERYGKATTNNIDALQKQTNALVKYRKTLNPLSKEFRTATKQINRNTKELKKFDKQIGRSQRNVGNYGSAFRRVFGAVGVAGGLFGFVRLLGNSIKIFRDFEKANKRLQAILGATADQMQRLSKQAKELGATTAFTASQVVALQTELAKLGFTAPQIEASTEGILSLAAATGFDLAESASLAGAAIRIFGLSAEETARVADVLAASTSKSALDMQKLATALPIVGTTAKQAGLNIEQTTALLGVLSDRGIDASTAATGLRNIFLELSKKGLTFAEAMAMINNSTDKSATAMDLFGKRSATAAVILAETGDATALLTEELNNAKGAAEEMAEVMLDNLAGDITKAKSAWEGFILSIEDGEGAISEAIRGVVQTFTSLFQSLTQTNTASGELQRRFDLKFWKDGLLHPTNYKELGNLVIRLEEIKAGFDNLTTEKQQDRLEKLRFVLKRLFVELSLARDEKDILQIKRKIELYTDYIKQLELLRIEQLKTTDVIEEDTKANEDNNNVIEEKTQALKRLKNAYKSLLVEANKAAGAFVTGEGIRSQRERIFEELDRIRIFEEAGRGLRSEGGELQKISFFQRISSFFKSDEGKPIAEGLTKGFGLLFESITEGVEDSLNRIDQLISRQDEAIQNTTTQLEAEKNRIQELKLAGAAFDTTEQQRLQKKLADDKQAKQKLLAEEKKLRQQQNRLKLVEAGSQISLNILKALGQPPIPGTNFIAAGIAAALGAVQLATIASAKFADGTNYVQLGGNPKGIDTVPAMLTEGEGVIKKSINKKIPYNLGFQHSMIPDAAELYLMTKGSGMFYADMGKTNNILTDIKTNTEKKEGILPDGSTWYKRGRSTIYRNKV
jgi:hypothetical protein